MSSALQARHGWTYSDLVALPDDHLRHELIDGEHFVSPSPTTTHQEISKRLQTIDREARDREGYRRRSQDRDDLAAWDGAAAWPDA